MPDTFKKPLKALLKLGVGFGILGYVLKTNMVNFRAVSDIILQPGFLLLAFGLIAASAIFCAARWLILARSQQLKSSLASMVELTMVGNFFNTFMPGSVGGDVIKAWYIAGQQPKTKTRAVLSVLVDRVIGLTVFFFVASIAILFGSHWVSGHPELLLLRKAIWGVSVLAVLFVGGFSVSRPVASSASIFERFLGRVPVLGGLAHKLWGAVSLYRGHWRVLLGAIGLSVLSIVCVIILYILIGRALGVGLTVGQFFFVVPVALTVSAVPLLPGGLGVGQVAFYKIFEWLGYADPQQGATLATVLQAYTIAFNCVGAIFYVRMRRSPQSSPVVSAEPAQA